jgi:hypothetical protein
VRVIHGFSCAEKGGDAMKQREITALVAAVALIAALGAPVLAETLQARLVGFQETPLTLSTPASGEFRAKISEHEDQIEFKLSYQDLEADVLFAHIHLGLPAITGGVIAFLCGGGSKPACPGPREGTVTGTIEASDIIGPAGQGIAPEEFEEAITAMRAGATYANVHTTLHPGGEIRGQIGRGKGGKD